MGFRVLGLGFSGSRYKVGFMILVVFGAPWTGGDRLVLVLCAVGCIENLEPQSCRLLESFGIRLSNEVHYKSPSELTTTGEPDLGMCLEICSGSARWSSAMQDAGFPLSFLTSRAPSIRMPCVKS